MTMDERLPKSATFDLRCGDNIAILQACADNSFDACVVDPPYGLAFMGKTWDYEVPSAETWREVMRVLKPGAHLLAFFGARTYHRGVVQIEDAGFEIRDQIQWVYGSGFPKSHNLEAQWKGWGTALKPACEPIAVARKPFKGTVAYNMATWGVGAINIDGCRVAPTGERLGGGDEKGKSPKPEGWARPWMDDAESVAKHNAKITTNVERATAMGRWPANVIHDGSTEVLDLFPESKGQQGDVRGTEKSKTGGDGTNCYGEYDRIPTAKRGDSGSAARFFYCAKASKSDRDEGLTTPEQAIVTFATANGTSGKPSSISEGRETAYRNNHPTVKPIELMRYLCRLVTPPNGIVLDPFMGSGSTGKACALEGFRFFGCEVDEGYFSIAQQRITDAYGKASEAAA